MEARSVIGRLSRYIVDRTFYVPELGAELCTLGATVFGGGGYSGEATGSVFWNKFLQSL